ncbi:cell division protein FtsQ/DivIB [Caldicellulosiruptoraceae bacterium PP1]
MKKLFKKILLLVIFLAIISVFLLTNQIFNINRIEILDLKRIKKDDIIKILRQYEGQNIFLTDTQKIKREILKNPEIDNVIIKRNLPNQLTINVSEKETIAFVEYMNSYIELDKKAYVIRISPKINKENIVLIGLKIKEVEIGKKLKVNDKFALEDGILLARKIKSLNYLDKLDYSNVLLDVQNINNFKIYLDKLTIEIGDKEDLDYKFKLAEAVINKLPKRIYGTITISDNGTAIFSPLDEEDTN